MTQNEMTLLKDLLYWLGTNRFKDRSAHYVSTGCFYPSDLLCDGTATANMYQVQSLCQAPPPRSILAMILEADANLLSPPRRCKISWTTTNPGGYRGASRVWSVTVQ